MSLVSCPECGRDVSDKAKMCPHCGYQVNAEHKRGKIDIKELWKNKGLSSESKRKIKGALIPTTIGIFFVFLAYLLFSPKTVSWCCIHRTQDATCTTPKQCLRCGKTWGNAKGHEWKGATCIAPKTCLVCGATDGSAKGHDWRNPTCTEPKTCKVCGITEGTARGHIWSAATCTTPKTCKECGEKSGLALGHNTVDYVCTRCGETVISYNDVQKVLDILDPRYEINYVGGIDQDMVFVNKSSKKTINYITIEMEFRNAVGDVIKNEIGGATTASICYTGPLGPGKKSKRTYWEACFYNHTFSGNLNIKEIRIDYSDGTKLVLNESVARYAVKNWR